MSRRQNLRSFPRAAAPAPAAAGHRPLVLAVALAAGFSALPTRAQPSGAQAVVGKAALSQQGNKLVVTTTNGPGNFSAVNWQSFSVPGGTTTYFAQPGATSTSINRVVGPDPSLIYGTLGSNGRLVLVNPAGITVGAGAVVDTAAFTASTLRMTDADMLNGRLRFGNGLGNLLKVDGTVLASQGDVVLIGQQVETGPQALIQSQGATVLAAGQKVEITGRGVEGIVFEVQAPADKAVNLGTLKGDAVAVFAGTLKHSGLIQAQAVTTEGGKVVLKAVDVAETSGAITAQGTGGAGGSVDVLGAKVAVLAGASIATSNTASGGSIRVGGDYQGNNAAVPNAQVTYVDKDATLRADATASGNGGKVIVWADDTTRAHGTISANAGPQGGDGGLVETSGKRFLDANGARVSASAANGKAGTWLLDPEDISIVGTGVDSIASSGGNLFFGLGLGLSQITDATLRTALNGGAGTNITVTTNNLIGTGTGDIRFVGNVDFARTTPGSATLNLDADGAIRFIAGGTTNFRSNVGSLSTSGGNLTVNMKAGLGGISTGIYTEPGATVQLSTDNSLSDVKVRVLNGQSWSNDGTLTLNLNGAVVLHDGTSAANLQNGATGTVNGSAGQRGGIDGTAGGLYGTFFNGGTVNLTGGVFNVASLTQGSASPPLPPGTFQYGGNGSMKVAGGFNVSGGAFSFTGQDLSIQQAAGSLVIPSSATIAATGTVVLAAPNGMVNIDGPVSSGSELGISAGNILSSTGGINLNAGISAPKVALEAWGTEGINQTIGSGTGITANELMLYTDKGNANLGDTGNKVTNLMASVSSMTLQNSADLLTFKSLTSNVLSANAFNAFDSGTPLLADDFGAVDIVNVAASATAGSGAVQINGSAQGGQLSVTAAGNIKTGAIFTTGVVTSGSVRLESTAGTVDVGDIDTTTPTPTAGVNGGYVTLIGTSVKANNITTDGYNNATSSKPGHAGGVTLTAGTGGVLVTGSISAKGGSGGVGSGGTGGSVSVSSQADVSLGAVDARGGDGPTGGQGGQAYVNAGTGAITITGSVNASSGAGGAGTSGVSGGGTINLYALNAIDTQALTTNGNAGTGTYGTRGGNVYVYGGSADIKGAVQAVGGSGTFGSGNGGSINITGATGVKLATIVDSHGGTATLTGSGGSGGFVSIGAAGGAVQLVNVAVYGGAGPTLGGGGGTFLLNAGGDVTGGANVDAYGRAGGQAGGNGGSVNMAAGGSIGVGTVDVSGGLAVGTLASAGGGGGSILLNAAGGGVTTQALLATAANEGTGAADGGDVTLLAAGLIQVNGRIDTSGSSSTQLGRTGGWGGLVTLASSGGGVTVTDTISTGGGSATYAGTAGDVLITAAGAVNLQSIMARGGVGASIGGGGGNLTVTAGGAVTVNGPIDVSGESATNIDYGVNGGSGGSVSISGSSVALGDIFSQGGTGGDLGGDGGDVTLMASAGAVTAGTIDLSAGGNTSSFGFSLQGGWGGNLDISGASVATGSVTTRGGFATSAVGGVAGTAGNVTLMATSGDITVAGPIDAVGGSGDTAGDGGYISLIAAGGVSVSSYIDASAGFGTAARGNLAGDIAISAGGNAVLGSDVAAEGASGFGTLYFAGAGTLSGSLVSANVYNEGTIAPGSPANPIGIFTVAGNYTQTATGRLLFEAVAAAENIPGVTYDQLRVFGTTDLAGSIEVNAIAQPPAAAAPFLALDQPLAALLAPAPAPTPTLVLIDSAGTTTGAFSSVTAPFAFATSLQISAATVLSDIIVTNVTNVPVSPPPPPAPVAPPGTPLVERIYELLNQEVSRNLVQQALTEQETIVTKFVALLLKEEKEQADDKKEQGKPDIVSTDTACKPS